MKKGKRAVMAVGLRHDLIPHDGLANPFEATDSVPKSPDRIATYIKRVEARQPLNNLGDVNETDEVGMPVRRLRNGYEQVNEPQPLRATASPQGNRLSLGANIRLGRKRAHLSVTSFAAKCGVRCRTVQRWERGQRTPGIQQLKTIAQVLRMTIAGLIGEVP